MKAIIGALLCFGVGIAIGYFLGAPEVDTPQTELAESLQESERALVQTLEKQLSTKESLIKVLNEELSEVRAALAAEMAAVDADAAETSAPANPFMSKIGPMAIEMTQTYQLQELEKYKRTLQLTPAQVKALEDFYQKDADRQNRITQQMFAGKSMDDILEESKDDFEGITHFTVRDVLEDILTPEQLQTYEANKEKEALEEQEARAYSDLSQIQRQFVLDENQKDAVFAIFYERDYEIEPEDVQALGLERGTLDFGMKYQELENERLLTALSEVLNEEQLAGYRQKLEADLEMQRKAMEMFSGGGFLQQNAE